jgi:hypothetical protein
LGKGITKITISIGIRELAHESTLDELIDIAVKNLLMQSEKGETESFRKQGKI